MTFWKAIEVGLALFFASIVPACMLVHRRNRLREVQTKEIFRVNKIKD